MSRQNSEQEATQLPDPDMVRHAEILDHLTQIQNSPAFCNSARSKEFLKYVVEQALGGQIENLKERSIGVNLFHRPLTYDTGEDPIVRVKAGEVRRRLGEYYAGEKHPPELHIELPVGSYVPKFRWRSQPADPTSDPRATALEQPLAPPKHSRRWKSLGIAITLTIAGIAATVLIRANYPRPSTLDQFWQPLSATKQPVLICVPTPVSYAVSSDLFLKSPVAKSGIYDTLAKRNETPLRLDPDTTIKWKQLTPLVDFYVNKDDAYAAEDLSIFFASEHRSVQIRFGDDYTYEELRNSPAILVGAFNNPWIERVMSDLPIGFRESGEVGWIEDRTKPGQVWKASLEGRRGSKDFAVVARLLNSKTGQFLIIISGVGMVGTKAAGQFITHEEGLETVARSAPRGWERKNMEIVLETDVIAGSPSPPRAVAVRVW